MQAGAEAAEATYEAMAPVYDSFTAHHDYEQWLTELLDAVQRHGLRGSRLLDVGCGTGKSFLPMLDRGWEVTGCDISPAMVELAKEKASDRAELCVADMLALPRFGEFDLVWAIDDAINYLLGPEELQSALEGMRDNLAPGGLLLFDVNTLLGYRTFCAETVVVEQGGHRLKWTGLARSDTPAGSICEAILTEEGGAAETHRHRQRHFPEPEVRDVLEQAGLKCLAIHGLYTDGILKQPLNEAVHTKAVYVARRS
jgi:SAM-dependent methyltransferase